MKYVLAALIGAIAAWGVSQIDASNLQDKQIEGCRSGNPLRQAVYNNSLKVGNTKDAAALVKAVEAYPLHPGSPQKDCEAAYG